MSEFLHPAQPSALFGSIVGLVQDMALFAAFAIGWSYTIQGQVIRGIVVSVHEIEYGSTEHDEESIINPTELDPSTTTPDTALLKEKCPLVIDLRALR